MFINKLYKTLLLPALLLTMLAPCSLYALEHKNEGVDVYMDQINTNIEEKTLLLKHIADNGSYLEVGGGSNTVMHLVENIDNKEDINNVNLTIADIDQSILDLIVKKNPEVKPLLDNNSDSKINLNLEQLDATNMKGFDSSSLNAINASSLVHEIHSYSADHTGTDRFFLEVARILKPGGVLIYRDPLLQSEPDVQNILVLHSKMSKHFSQLFIARFFDTQFSQIVDFKKNPIKGKSRLAETVENTSISLHKKDSPFPVQLSLTEFMQTPAEQINLDKDMTVISNRRFLAELQRHYLLFIKDNYPEYFLNVDAISEGDTLDHHLSKIEKFKLAHKLTTDALSKINAPTGKAMTADSLKVLKHNLESFYKISGDNIEIQGSSADIKEIYKSLRTADISPALYEVNPESIVLDPKLFAKLYQGPNKSILKHTKITSTKSVPWIALDWIKREGEERYYYMTTDELLGYLYSLSISQFKNVDKNGYVLFPSNAESGIMYTYREFYDNLLKRDMTQLSLFGETEEFETRKLIIYLQLQKVDEANKVISELVSSSANSYPNLTKLKETIERK